MEFKITEIENYKNPDEVKTYFNKKFIFRNDKWRCGKKEYFRIYEMKNFFNKKVLGVRLKNKNYAFIDENLKTVCEFPYIYGMKNFFNKDVLKVGLRNENDAYLDKNLKIIFEYDEIIKKNENKIIFELNKKVYEITNEVKN